MVWMVAPLRLSLSQWRLSLLAALLLLAGAMGGGKVDAREGAGPATGGCNSAVSCEQRLTAPIQPALIQAALRVDGKAMAGGDGVPVTLPAGHAMPFRLLAGGWEKPLFTGTHLHRGPTGPGQPRGPPSDR